MNRNRVKVPVHIECKYCGKKIEKVHYAQKFCSSACRNDWHNEERLELIQAGREAIRGTKV